MSFKPESLNFKEMQSVCASVSDIELMLNRSKLLLSHWDDLAIHEVSQKLDTRITVFIAPDMRVDLDEGLCSNISIGVGQWADYPLLYRTYKLPESGEPTTRLLTTIYESWSDCNVHVVNGKKNSVYPVGGCAEYEYHSNKFSNPKRKQLLNYVITYLELYLQWLKTPFDCAKFLSDVRIPDQVVVKVITSIRDRGQLLLDGWVNFVNGYAGSTDDGLHVDIDKGLCYNLRSQLEVDLNYLTCRLYGVDLDYVLSRLYTQWYGTVSATYPVGGWKEYEEGTSVANKFSNPRRKELCEFVVDSMNLCLEYWDDQQNAK